LPEDRSTESGKRIRREGRAGGEAAPEGVFAEAGGPAPDDDEGKGGSEWSNSA
jgi:hypothetical protein